MPSSSAHSLALLLAGTTPPEPAASAEGAWDDHYAACAAKGDSEAFRSLVARHESPLHGFCLHLLGCHEDARDAAQETFVRAWHALSHYEPRRRFRAWLWRIALNLCRDRLRTKKRRGPVVAWNDLPEGALLSRDQDPGEAAQWRSEIGKLSRALEAMPESMSWPLTLYAVEGLSHAECAAVLGLSIRAVEGRIHRARAWLEDWWPRHS